MAMIGDTLRRVEIRFPLTFSAVASVIFLGLTYWYWRDTQSIKETLLFFAVGATAVGQITASFYTARVLGSTLSREARDMARETAADTREREFREFSLKKEALRFGERWNHPAMHPARDTLRKIMRHRHQTSEELIRFAEENDTAVNHVINFLEEMATACRQNIVDVVVMKDQFDVVIVTTWETLWPWIRKSRQEGSPAVWEDTERLYDLWKKRS